MSESQRGASAATEASEESSPPEDEVTGVPREALVIPPGPIGSIIANRIHHYITKTGVEAEFFNLLHKLLGREELPYNPYPGFAVRLRPFMEKFHIDREAADKIEYALSVPLKETRIPNLYTVQQGEPIWGLRSVLRCVNAFVVNRYRWLADNITPSYYDLFQKEGYSNQVMVALVGAAIFHGSFYRQVHIAKFRLEYLVTGKRVDEAISIFVNSVMIDIDSLVSSEHHILIGLSVPVMTTVSDDGEILWQQEFWDPETIQMNKGDLMQKISNSVIGNKHILAECVFRLDPVKKELIQGQKQYTLNFVKVEDEIREEGLSNFAEFPMASVHEGLFFNQTHAECYVSMFTPQTESLDNSNIRRASANPSVGQTTRRQSSVAEDDFHYIHRHVHQRLQHHKPRKAKIDGFRLGDDPGSGPYAWQITTPFKSELQKNIVAFHPWAQLFEIVYYLILLVLMDRKTSDVPVLMELYKLCNSTAGKLHMLGEHNKAIRALIRAFINRADGYRLRRYLLLYKDSIDEMLAKSLHERSMDQISLGKAMSSQITELLKVSDEDLCAQSHLDQMGITLRDQHSFILSSLMRMSEDVLYWAPLVKEHIEQLHKSFPELVPRPESNVRSPYESGPRDRLPKSVYMKHGFEDEHIMKHEHSVIVVADCMNQGGHPQAIAREAVLMRYIIDTHLEETWGRFLEESFEGRPEPPMNPYPSLINMCRTCAMKMDLCYEPEATTLGRILTKMARVVDVDNYVYQLPSCEACGPVTAVSMLDPGAYVPIWQCVKDYLLNKAYIHRKGPYRIGICLGLTGPSLLYGKMRSYLCQLDLHEHYYIQGPIGCETDAAQLLAVMIQKHVYELVAGNKVPVLGVFLGNDRVRWSWEEVINKKLGFFTEVEMIILRKEPVYLKAYALFDGWRYVPVVKHFLLHYLTDDGLSNECFFEPDPTLFYCTVFSSVERAAFHYQNDGPPRGGDPLNTSNTKTVLSFLDNRLNMLKEMADWMEAYRLLLLRSFLCDDTAHIVGAWRMFHSMAAQAEYVAYLAQSVAELVEFELEYLKFFNVEMSTTGRSDLSQRTGGSPVNLGVLSAMWTGLTDKSKCVSEGRISQCAGSMAEFINFKLRNVSETEAATKKVYPIISEQTVTTLTEIQHMFHNIKTTVSADVHNTSDTSREALSEIDEECVRPRSVDSHVLNDPQMYQRRPRAGRKIVDDEMLYKPFNSLYKPRR